MVAAAAGRMNWKAVRHGPASSVRATLSYSRRSDATPNAVLSSMGQMAQMKMTKMTKMAEMPLSLIV